jgi:phosphoglycolate phosphatase-like HAD superfamily hydrolase
MLIGLDLDGTLLDSRLRHVAAIQQAAEDVEVPMSESKAWAYFQLKCEGRSGIEALQNLGIPLAAMIIRRWIEIIETEEMLAFDQLYPDTMDALKSSRARGNMFVLATGRQNAYAARKQIARLGLEIFFSEIVVIDPLDRSRTKAVATRHHDFDAIVGDTEVDLEWANELKKSFYASSYGFRAQSYWRSRQVTGHITLSEIFDTLSRFEET